MGKNGRRMQEEKKRVTYSYTAEQIADIRRQAVRDATKQIVEETAAQLRMSAVMDSLALTLAIPVTVLCRDFGWKPIGEKHDGRNRLNKFVDAIIAESNKIVDDPDIKGYCERCGELYGVSFKSEVTESDKGRS